MEIPKDPQNGDYASSFAMAGAKAMKMAPRAIAQAVVDHMDLTDSLFASVEIAGPGFLNFRLGRPNGMGMCWRRLRPKVPSTDRVTRAGARR